MITTKLPRIVDVIGRHFSTYNQVLEEARNLAGREQLDAEERRRFGELVQHLERDKRSAELLAPEQRACLDAVLEAHTQRATPASASISDITADYILLKNIRCVDADGNQFEHYPELYVAKDIVRDDEGTPTYKTLYRWITYFEKQGRGIFLPSSALTVNILAVLFENKDDPEIRRVLMQYKDKGDNNGLHAQNTIVQDRSIIHYPRDGSFRHDNFSKEPNQRINQERKPVVLGFPRNGLERGRLKAKLLVPDTKRTIHQLSGRDDPEILVEIAEYFGRAASIGLIENRFYENRIVLFGCGESELLIDVTFPRQGITTARGVFVYDPVKKEKLKKVNNLLQDYLF
jgi:hypothetical protein